MNVRTLSDLRREESAREERAPILAADGFAKRSSSYSLGNGTPRHLSSHLSSFSSSSRSLPVKFLELLFPHITWKSVLLLIAIGQWTVYIVMLCIESELPLVPSSTVLANFGANIPPLIVKGEIWRLICPVFLHANFVHIFFNTFFQMRMGFSIERKYGIFWFILLYFISGILGNAFSAAVFFCDLKVGASTAGFGMIGLQMSELILNWQMMRHRERVMMNMIIFIVMMILFMFTFSGGTIDQMGHLGGFLSGLSLGYLFNANMDERPNWYSIGQYIAIALIVILAVVSFTILFTLKRTCNWGT